MPLPAHWRVIRAFSGFSDDLEVADGYVHWPDLAGIGFERKQALYPVRRRLAA
jgi:hypothetical protein